LRVTFGTFTLDASARQLLCGSRRIPISPKAFDLLALLVGQRPAAVSKAEIHQRLWPNVFVSDGNLTVLMTELRNALGDDARHPSFVRTLHRFGYAFVAPAVDTSVPAAARPISTQCWLVSANDRAPLLVGDNVIGRDPLATIRIGLDAAADLRIDSAGISRRHALVIVADASVTVQDLSSKNGTFADDVRVTGPVSLEHGAYVRLGAVSVQFCRVADVSATQTHDVCADS
jgi:DNA-binding winged helix-turn-helix (wHTH) protein